MKPLHAARPSVCPKTPYGSGVVITTWYVPGAIVDTAAPESFVTRKVQSSVL